MTPQMLKVLCYSSCAVAFRRSSVMPAAGGEGAQIIHDTPALDASEAPPVGAGAVSSAMRHVHANARQRINHVLHKLLWVQTWQFWRLSYEVAV
jgi:hypothetical protein